jgi:hypothetical protein
VGLQDLGFASIVIAYAVFIENGLCAIQTTTLQLIPCQIVRGISVIRGITQQLTLRIVPIYSMRITCGTAITQAQPKGWTTRSNVLKKTEMLPVIPRMTCL